MVGRGRAGKPRPRERPLAQAGPPASHPPQSAGPRRDTPADDSEQPPLPPDAAEASQRAVDTRLAKLAKLEKAVAEAGGNKDHLLDGLADIRRDIQSMQRLSDIRRNIQSMKAVGEAGGNKDHLLTADGLLAICREIQSMQVAQRSNESR